jgi:uncharacterized membrane protein YfcA
LNEGLFLVEVIALGILSGATAAVIGFGIGSLLTPLLLTRLEPDVAISVVALPHLIATATRYVHHRRWIDRTVLLRFGPPSAVGGVLGALLQGTLHSPVLMTVLAILLLLTGIANLTQGFGGWHPRPLPALGVGLLSGIFGGLVGNQGGLRAAGLSAFNLEPRPYLATGTAVALLIDLARTPIYLIRGGGELLEVWLPILMATVGCLMGTIFGERLFLRISPERYRRVIGVAVLILGVWLLASLR